MKRAGLLASLMLVGAALGVGSDARAQPGRLRRPTVPAFSREEVTEEPKAEGTRALRGRFGLDVAERLAHGTSEQDRLRGIARARSLGTPEAINFLVEQAARVTSGDGDGPVAIELARALDAFRDNERARGSLYEMTVMPARLGTREAGAMEDPVDAEERERARTMAALALARTGEPRAYTLLSDTIRTNGPGAHAAKIALFAHPPDKSTFATSSQLAPAALDYIVKSGDLRALPAVLALADSSDPQTRAAALQAAADLGDTRAIAIATPLLHDDAADLRVAATYVIVRLAAPDAEKTLLALLADATTALAAIDMSEYVQSDAITKELATRAMVAPDEGLRVHAAYALSRQRGALAARSLLTLALGSPVMYEAAHALARSPSPVAASAIESLLTTAPKNELGESARRLGARAYLVRAMVRGERSQSAEEMLKKLTASKDPRDRAIATEALVALDVEIPEKALDSKDVDVRRAAAEGLFSKPSPHARALLAQKLVHDEDPAMRMLATLSLLVDDEDSPKVTSTWLADRATSGGADAPLAALAFVRRAEESDLPKVDALLQSTDFLLRAHAARGLAASQIKASVGRLARLYAYEPNALVRRAVILALAQRPEKDAPLYDFTLREASLLDPDAEIRFLANNVLAGRPVANANASTNPMSPEAVWIRVTEPGTPAAPTSAAYMRSDGLSVPLVFDREGHAVVLGVTPGAGRIFMTPTLP